MRERRESARKEDRHAEDQASRVAQELIHEEEQSRVVVAPWQCPAVPPPGASDASEQPGTPKKKPPH